MSVAIDHETRTIMSQAITRSKRLRLGPRAAGMLLTPEELPLGKLIDLANRWARKGK
jgi:hypothetical protein